MKNNILYVMLTLAAVLLASCQNEKVVYGGPDYIMFSDTLTYLPVPEQLENEYYDIPVCATRAADHDRTIAVEVVPETSNAIEGYHYSLESNTLTLKAGELVTNVRVKGYYDHLETTDSLEFTLRLITEKEHEWNLYQNDIRVQLSKFGTYNRDDFVGPCVVKSTYLKKFAPLGTEFRLFYSEKDPEDDNSVILKDFFYKGHDVKVTFDTKEPYEPLLRFDEQIFGDTREAFSAVYGDCKIWMSQPKSYPSYFNACEKSFVQVMTLEVKGVGIVGTFVNLVERITEEEAEQLRQHGY